MEPPQPQNNGTVIEGEDGTYIEVDEFGTSLGKWHWDPVERVWLFEVFTPLNELPQTGLAVIPVYILGIFRLLLCGAGLPLRIATKKRSSRQGKQ